MRGSKRTERTILCNYVRKDVTLTRVYLVLEVSVNCFEKLPSLRNRRVSSTRTRPTPLSALRGRHLRRPPALAAPAQPTAPRTAARSFFKSRASHKRARCPPPPHAAQTPRPGPRSSADPTRPPRGTTTNTRTVAAGARRRRGDRGCRRWRPRSCRPRLRGSCPARSRASLSRTIGCRKSRKNSN